jgi:hypothetical protein
MSGYMKRRVTQIAKNKEKGEATYMCSEKELEEYLKGSLHKFRKTWNMRAEAQIALLAVDKHYDSYPDMMQEIKQQNKRYFEVHGLNKKGILKDASPTRAQRAIVIECLRDMGVSLC